MMILIEKDSANRVAKDVTSHQRTAIMAKQRIWDLNADGTIAGGPFGPTAPSPAPVPAAGVTNEGGGTDTPTVYTWATRPAAAGNAGKVITIQQAGLVGQYLSDGTDWVPLGRVALGANGNPGTTTSGTAETVLASWLLPGKALSPAGRFELFAALQYTNSAANKNLNLRLGGTGVNGSVLWTHTVTATRKILMRTGFMARNGYAAQIGTATDYSPGYATITTDVLTSAVDMSVNQTVYLTAQCAAGADLVTLHACAAEII